MADEYGSLMPDMQSGLERVLRNVGKVREGFYSGQYVLGGEGAAVCNLEILDVSDDYEEGELGGATAISVRVTDRMEQLDPAFAGRIAADLESVGFVVTRVKER